jgi:hypothetical protein
MAPVFLYQNYFYLDDFACLQTSIATENTEPKDNKELRM